MEISSVDNPYERKLFNMFKSYDKEKIGSLDKEGLKKLCKSLELKDQGSVLIHTVLKDNKRVSFKCFKDALLNFLGSEIEDEYEDENLIITQNDSKNQELPDSPGREVSPKLIVGNKKYGRRSRPQSLIMDSSDSASENYDDDDMCALVPNLDNHKLNKVKRSSSQSEIRKRRPGSGNTKLKRCSSLPAQYRNQKPKEQLLVKQNPTTGTSESASESEQNHLTSSVDSLDFLQTPLAEILSAGTIIDMWHTAGINEPKHLLSNLGFDNEDINISELLSTLEEEIHCLSGESQIPVLKAALILRKAEIISLQKFSRQIFEENKILQADCKEANRRVSMLAQEIDERHATLEDNTKSEIRILEQRHAEVVKDLTTQLVSDRENWSSVNTRLENRVHQLEQEGSQLKNELQTLYDEVSALENEQIALQKQITDLLETNIKLNNEIVELEERQRTDEGEKETEEVLELIEKITSLQIENANLRDKNDELVAEIEGITMELNRIKRSTSNVTSGDSDILSDDFDQISSGAKRRGDSPSKARVTEESPKLGKLRKCNEDSNERIGNWIALNAEMNSTMVNSSCAITPTTSGFSQDFSSITIDDRDSEILNLKDKVTTLEQELKEYKNSSLKIENQSVEDKTEIEQKNEVESNEIDDTNGNIVDYKTRCKELEDSLEQMKRAYEDCEDYWHSKLKQERQLFEKERQIYDEEQQENDKKFAELLDKIKEYEEQLDKEGRTLFPIEENSALEQQYIDLETEIEDLKENSAKVVSEKTKEIQDLQEQIKELQEKLQEKSDNLNSNNANLFVYVESPASSPISYLLNQSTIQMPVRDYQNPNWTKTNTPTYSDIVQSDSNNFQIQSSISPIQKPISPHCSIQKFSVSDVSTKCLNSDAIKEELKTLKYIEVELKEQIKDLVNKRDSLLKPFLEEAHAKNVRITLGQRVNQLEQKNRNLQNIIRQQQQYAESFMHQSWQQQRQEIIDLRNRLDAQAILINDQVQRLANADILVKDLYMENSHLTATIQRLEQQRSRAHLMHQHHQGLTGLP